MLVSTQIIIYRRFFLHLVTQYLNVVVSVTNNPREEQAFSTFLAYKLSIIYCSRAPERLF